MPNRLIDETSPYLLSHARQPVDWHPWGEEALRLARELDRPVFLSVGYAACHWCHVMARESFEDPAVAAFLNGHFVCVKVDREERPDLDHVYMQAVIAMNGHGGWPMTVFLRPDGRPFFGGTYFPPAPRGGLPGFLSLAEGVDEAWRTRRDFIDEVCGHLLGSLQEANRLQAPPGALDDGLFPAAVAALRARYDERDGGFGDAPRFPPAMILDFLLAELVRSGDSAAREMVVGTLDGMARGGMHDLLGGGFCRYATDRAWRVPHFEKMLTDNALLARVYLRAWRVTGEVRFRAVAEATLDFLRRELEHPEGGFYASLDADAPDGEGRYYTWEAAEVERVLGDDAGLFCAAHGVTAEGNWEGVNILSAAVPVGELASTFGLSPDELEARLRDARRRLLEARDRRARPGLDHKRLAGANGLALAALAEAGSALDRPELLEAALRCAWFVRDRLRRSDGRLWRTCSPDGLARHAGVLEDYAYLADGLLALHQATLEPEWSKWARELADLMLTHFSDHADGGFFDTADDHERLPVRPRELQDQAQPNPHAVAVDVLLRLASLEREVGYHEAARRSLECVSGLLGRFPQGFARWLTAVHLFLHPVEVTLDGDPSDPRVRSLAEAARERWIPGLILTAGTTDDGEDTVVDHVPAFDHVPALDDVSVDVDPMAVVCRDFTCSLPVTTPAALRELLKPGVKT